MGEFFETIKDNDKKYKEDEEIKILLKIKNVINMSCMFYDCDRLLYVNLLGNPYDDKKNSSLSSFSSENDFYYLFNNYGDRDPFCDFSISLNQLNFSDNPHHFL